MSKKKRTKPKQREPVFDPAAAYPSTGEVFETKTKKLVTALKDETGRAAHSEKMIEIDFRDGAPVRNGDQFGVGRAR